MIKLRIFFFCNLIKLVVILGQRVLGARDRLEIIRKERCGGGVRMGEHPGGVTMVWYMNLRLTPLEEIEVEEISLVWLWQDAAQNRRRRRTVSCKPC